MSGHTETDPVDLRLEAVAFEVVDAASAAAFWAGLLDREVVTEPDGALVPGDPTQVGLRFVGSERGASKRSRLHLHLTSSSPDDQQRTVELALSLGGRHHDVGQTAEDRFVVLADPQGNEFCVIEPGNAYLEGTGLLGEVTGDGTRAVGLFWRDALGWPLVWDEGEQTAIQSPLGGTKLAWDAWDESPDQGPEVATRQRFDLVCTDLAAAVDRLSALGTAELARRGDGVLLTDPDGQEFRLRSE